MAISVHDPVKTGIFKEIRRESGNKSKQPLRGYDLKYDKGFDKYGRYTTRKYRMAGDESQKAVDMGLPLVVYGRPLGCGCNEAYLHGVGEIIDGQLECDYMCSSGWHNFILFSMRTQDATAEREVKLDKYGNLTENVGFEATELEEF